MSNGLWVFQKKYAARVLFISLLLLLVSCGKDNPKPNPETDQANAAGSVAVPQAVQRFVANNPGDGALAAYVRIDDGNRQAMTITGNKAQLTIEDLSQGDHKFTVEFEFDSQTYGKVILAQGSKNVPISGAGFNIEFGEADYDFPDDDQDQISNLEEMEAGTHPGDSTCVIDHSKIGSCTLG